MLFDNSKKLLRVFCNLPFARAKVNHTGHLSMCCHQDFRISLGNLLEKKLR